MKVTQVLFGFPPDIGGVESHAYNLSLQLAKRGQDVEVVTTKPKGSRPRENMGGVRVTRYWCIDFGKLPLFRFSSVRHIPFLSLRLMLTDTDIYHSHGYGSLQPACAALAAIVRRRPFVFTVHGYPKLKGPSAVFKWLYTNTLARFFLGVASRVITVTDATLPDLEREVPRGKIRVIPNGVDFSRFRPRSRLSSLKTNRIVYLGRLDKYKDVGTLIRAFSIVRKTVPSATLHIIGPDEGMMGSLSSLASKLGVNAEFRQVPQNEMPEVYESASVVVLPSRYEGLSLVLLEAIASERPMLSTPVGAAPALFKEVYKGEEPRFIFETGNHYELAGKIISILENKPVFEKTCAGARKELKKRYSWEAAAGKTIDVYKEALGE